MHTLSLLNSVLPQLLVHPVGSVVLLAVPEIVVSVIMVGEVPGRLPAAGLVVVAMAVPDQGVPLFQPPLRLQIRQPPPLLPRVVGGRPVPLHSCVTANRHGQVALA